MHTSRGHQYSAIMRPKLVQDGFPFWSRLVQGLFKACSRCVQGLFKACSRCVQGLFNVLIKACFFLGQGFVQGLVPSKYEANPIVQDLGCVCVCANFVQGRFKACSRIVQGLFKICSRIVQGLFKAGVSLRTPMHTHIRTKSKHGAQNSCAMNTIRSHL